MSICYFLGHGLANLCLCCCIIYLLAEIKFNQHVFPEKKFGLLVCSELSF